MDKTVLVTGSSGFLGQAILPRLAASGFRAIGLDPRPAATTQVIDDLADQERLRVLIVRENITHIIHAGGVSGPMVMADAPARVVAINVMGSLNLLQAAIETGVQTFVYCSSVSALGNFYENGPVGEDHPLYPTSTYGCSKAAMDMALRGLWKRVPLDICSLRFTTIYGPGRTTRFVIDEIVTAAMAGKPAQLAPQTDWPYIYIDDAADAAVRACFADSRKQLVYYVAHPEQVTLDDLAAAAEAAGRSVQIQIDKTCPIARRGPLDTDAAAHDFAFSAKIGHREGVRRMIAAAAKGEMQPLP